MVTIVAFATYTEIQNHRQMSDLTRKNLIALTSGENDTYPGYKNVTDKSTIKEVRVEIDENGAKFEYEVSCVVYHTYCKSASASRVCYSSLNGTIKESAD